MSRSRANPDIFEPGSVIVLEDSTLLAEFEDVVAFALSPEGLYGPVASPWQNRTALKDELRPHRFNGRIANIAMTVIGEAEEQIKEHDGKFGDLKTLGFTLTADALSSGRGVVAQIQTKLWYRQQRTSSMQYHYGAITRKVDKPVLSQNRIELVYDDSVQIAFEATRSMLRRAKHRRMTQ